MSTIVFAFLTSYAAQAALISVSPGSHTVSQGSVFTVNVDITDAVDLYSYQLDLGFDPSALSAVSITEGPFLLGGGATFFIPGFIDNTAGLISFTANVLLGAVPGVNGSGTLAVVEFSALAVGTSSLSLSNIILLDSQLAEIAFTATNGTVIAEESAVPEPSGFVLLGTAAVLLCLRCSAQVLCSSRLACLRWWGWLCC